MKNFLLLPEDIYIEINGIKLASIKSYDIYNSKKLINIKLSKISFVDENNFLEFFKLSNFNLVIFKPNSQLIFSGCNWEYISETAQIEKPILNSLSLVAQRQIII
ncbi:MAG: hypothetical protein J6C55_01865 [Oscillospiraceae bacterium]|nr:hypothetical protein [Oscillospiraceae bacterium]